MKIVNSNLYRLLIATSLMGISAGCSFHPFSFDSSNNSSFNSMANTAVPIDNSMANNSAPSIRTHYDAKLTVGSQQLLVEVANTNQTRQQGLSGRESMGDDEGMLFDFSETGRTQPGFWMKDMHFALDFIWIDGNKIIGITTGVEPGFDDNGQLPLYYPPAQVTKVLEVNSGWVLSHGIKVGDVVSMK